MLLLSMDIVIQNPLNPEWRERIIGIRTLKIECIISLNKRRNNKKEFNK